MITTLKAMLESDTEVIDNICDDEMIADQADKTNVRDMFLDDPNAAIIGAEDDPEVAKFVASIPEDEDGKNATAEDIAKITESMDKYFEYLN